MIRSLEHAYLGKPLLFTPSLLFLALEQASDTSQRLPPLSDKPTLEHLILHSPLVSYQIPPGQFSLHLSL